MALVISGVLNSRGSAIRSAADTAGFVRRWKENVYRPLLDGSSSVHTFFCCALNAGGRPAASEANDEWSSLPGELIRVDANGLTAANAPLEQFGRIERCFLAARRHEASRGLRFTHFIRARPDLFWFGPMPALLSLDSRVVSSRARVAVLADECGMMPHDAHSFPSLEQHPQNARACRRDACACNNACQWAPALGLGGLSADGFKGRMRRAGVAACGLIDDMWAVVPSRLADGYFMASGQPDASPAATTHRASDASPPQTTPGGHHHVGGIRIRRSAGPTAAESELGARALEVCAPFLPNVSDPENATLCWPLPRANRSWCKQLDGELRLTARLARRRIPWAPTAFSFAGAAVGARLHAATAAAYERGY